MNLPVVALVGNPNVGKTSLFNQLTGGNARVGNYAGVTVEVSSGRLAGGDPPAQILDVPGCYSLAARSREEALAIELIAGLAGGEEPALVVVVVDATQLIRNLYLVLQLAELRVPLVVALNMWDEAVTRPPDVAALERRFGVPFVRTNARQGEGVLDLAREIRQRAGGGAAPVPAVHYPEPLRRDTDALAEQLPASWRKNVERDRALARWVLESAADDEGSLPAALHERASAVRAAAERAGRDLDLELVGARYALLDEWAPELVHAGEVHPPKRPTSERVDRVLLHPVWGLLVFVAVMVLVFQALFSWAEPAMHGIELAVHAAQGWVTKVLPAGLARDFVVEGALGGVGNVLTFLPQIVLLFTFIGLLEDSGYMARVAYLMDRVMRSLGLHGRAFVPMLSGFACAVPAILATRTLERRRDRLLTMLVVPLMTCSARLPVYTLVIAALFPPGRRFAGLPVQALAMAGMYVFSLLVTLLAASVIGRTVVRGRRVPLLLELPPYRRPVLLVIGRAVIARAGAFVREAGTVIMGFTLVLWVLLAFPRQPDLDHDSTTPSAVSQRVERSYAGRLGHALEPALEPLGFDWKIGVGIIGAFAAREVFVSTLGLVYGIGQPREGADADAPLRERLRSETDTSGAPRYRALTGVSLMVFFALACQCMSTLAAVKRETQTWRWPAFVFAYMTGLAYLASLAVYQVGSALGL